MKEAEILIRQYMVGMNIKYVNTLSERIGMRRQTLANKLVNPSTFTAGELKAMAKFLNISDEDMGKLIRSV
jgi:hypothetical protein